MVRYHGGEAVKAGFYWSPAQWEIITLSKGGGVLPGTNETLYIRLPMLLFIVVGPFMGALYVAFLPFIGFAMVLGLGAIKLYGLARNVLTGRATAEETIVNKTE